LALAFWHKTVGGWSGALQTDGQNENSYISQLRIQNFE